MIRGACALGAVIVILAVPSVAVAQQEERFSTDISATAGYSNNPFAVLGGDTGSALVGLDILPSFRVLTARSTMSVSGSASLQQYLRRYGRNDSYNGTVDYQLRPSEQVTAHTRLDLSSAVIGAYNTYLPTALGIGQVGSTGTTTGSIPSATAFPALTDIGLYGFRNRRRLARLSGDVSANVSVRDSVTVSGYAEAARYRRLPQFGDYEGYGGSVAYSRRVSDHFTVGIRASASSYDYKSNQSGSRVFPVEATVSGRLSALWTVDGALGATFVTGGSTGSTRQTSVSGNLNACRRGELSIMCVQAARQVSPTGLVGSQYVTSAGFNWSKQLSERANLSLNGSYSKVGGGDTTLLLGGLPLQNEFAQAVVGYDRQISPRLRLVASANYRQLLNGNAGRPKDFGGQLGLSYHIGDMR